MLAGKWLFGLAKPSNLWFAAVVLGALFAHRRAGRRLLLAALVAVPLVTLGRLGDRAVAGLEAPWLDIPPPEHVVGIVVLGGGTVVMPPAGMDERAALMHDDIERVLAPIWLLERYPAATLVFTGGGGGLWSDRPSEADNVAWLWQQLGFAPAASFEAGSLNTRDNAVNTRALVEPAVDETWLLVTSAVHMRRALATFRKVGWTVHPYAVDFRSRDRDGWPGDRLVWADQYRQLDLAAREWIGLLVYRLRGWA